METQLRRIVTVSLVTMCVPFNAVAQTAPAMAPTVKVADFRLIVLGYFDADTLAEFHRRVRHYDELRRIAERTVPPLAITDDADEITAFERALTASIRQIRRSSARGQIFPAPMTSQVKKLLLARVNADTLSAIMDDAPGEFDIDIHETYPKYRSLATMPPNILLLLPDLADDMEDRFVGRHLIVRDMRANMVVDEIPFALSGETCAGPTRRAACY
jgi:hypothetical protein